MRLTIFFRACWILVLSWAVRPNVAFGVAGDTAVVAARYHCAGGAALTGNTNLLTLQKALSLPGADAVKKMVLTKFPAALADNYHFGANASDLLRPLWQDVLESESLGSFGGDAGHPLSFVIAVRLDAGRQKLWRENLEKIFGGAGQKFAVEDFKGQRWVWNGPDLFWMISAGNWALVGHGDGLLPVLADYLEGVRRHGQPSPVLQNHWLEADLDLPRMAGWSPDWLRFFKPGHINLAVTAGIDSLQTTAQVIYPETIAWESQARQIPKGLVPSSFNSFTTGQNILPFLNLDPKFSRLDGNPLTNQFYLWALGRMPFLTYGAWPSADPTNDLEKLSTEATNDFNLELHNFDGAELVWLTNQERLVLANFRVVLPAIDILQESNRNYLFMNFFQRVPGEQATPEPLWKQLESRTNLVYYDWEKTGPRLEDWQMLGRMFLFKQPRDRTDDALRALRVEEKWLVQVSSLPGEAVTEVTRVSPNELSVARKSPFGFTGIEIFLLSDWLSAVGSLPDPDPSAH